MDLTPCSLVTIVSESALEGTLLRDIEALGARGYTITEARGKGGHGQRDAAWAPHANIRIEVLCDAAIADAITTAVRTRYYDNYSIVMFVSQVGVLRPEKFRR